MPDLENSIFLIDKQAKMSLLVNLVRKRLPQLQSSEAVFFLVNNSTIQLSSNVLKVYEVIFKSFFV